MSENISEPRGEPLGISNMLKRKFNVSSSVETSVANQSLVKETRAIKKQRLSETKQCEIATEIQVLTIEIKNLEKHQ